MGASVGTEGKGSVNVELNIVPFIDLLSCLTAFLLVTAVWVNIAQISIQPKGKSRGEVETIFDEFHRMVLGELDTETTPHHLGHLPGGKYGGTNGGLPGGGAAGGNQRRLYF